MKFMTSVALALSALVLHAAAAPGATPTNVELVKLTLWNRAGYCGGKGGCVKLEKNRTVETWTIHSLAPFMKDGENTPTNCSTFKFNEDDVKDIKGDLNKFWPSFTNTNNASLWETEFNERGRCALNQTKEYNTTLAYFKKAVDMFKEVGLTKMLETAGFKPNDTVPIPKAKIDTFLSKLTNKVEIICEGQKNKTDILQEVRICYDLQLKAIPCPNADKHSNCKTDSIYYLQNSSTLGMPSALLVLFVTLVALFTSKN